MYRLYIDEVGSDGLTNLDNDNHRFLSLTGVAVKLDHVRDSLEPNMNWIKANVFNHDPDSPIVFHRKEILDFKGPYEVLRDEQKRELFDRAILRLISSTEYMVITALIDKQWMVRQEHWERVHPYHFLMEIMVEKYTQFLERKNDIGDIMPESRHRKDRLLQLAYNDVRQRGSAFVKPELIRSMIRAQTLKFRTKKTIFQDFNFAICSLILAICLSEKEWGMRSILAPSRKRFPIFSSKQNMIVHHGTEKSSAMELNTCPNSTKAALPAPPDGLMYHLCTDRRSIGLIK